MDETDEDESSQWFSTEELLEPSETSFSSSFLDSTLNLFAQTGVFSTVSISPPVVTTSQLGQNTSSTFKL